MYKQYLNKLNDFKQELLTSYLKGCGLNNFVEFKNLIIKINFVQDHN